MSSVELHRRDGLERLQYDLTNALDLAIWSALQTYVAYLETASLGTTAGSPLGASFGRGTIYDAGGVDSLTVRPPGELEECMLRLRDAEVGESGTMDDEERFTTALRVLECLSLPIWNTSGRRLGYGDGEFRVQRNFWGAGERLLAEAAGENSGEGLCKEAVVSKELPLYYPERVARL